MRPTIRQVFIDACHDIDLFLKPIFPIIGLLVIKAFWTFEMILLRISSYLRVSAPLLFVHIMYTQRREFLLMYLPVT